VAFRLSGSKRPFRGLLESTGTSSAIVAARTTGTPKNAVALPAASSDNRIPIDAHTLESIRLEVLSVIPESLYSVALAIIGSDTVRLMHEVGYYEEENSNGRGSGDGSSSSGSGSSILASLSRISIADGRSEETDAEKAERRVQELISALQTLVQGVGSVHRTIESWEEAQAALSEVLILPGEIEDIRRAEEARKLQEEAKEEEDEARQQEEFAAPSRRGGRGTIAAFIARSAKLRSSGKVQVIKRNLSVKKYAGLIQLAQLDSQRKFKQLTCTSIPPPIAASAADDEASLPSPGVVAQSSILSPSQRMDRLIDQRFQEAEAAARAKERDEAERQDAEIAAREEREEAEAAAAEAANRASSLLRPLTEEEQEIVRDAIYGIGPPDEVLATSDTDSVQRQSLHKLQPGVWLNDEVIHYFLLMLARRDAKLCEEHPSRKPCHFFKSFFITKILDDGRGYRYANVKRWSKKVPGKDIFNLDRIFFPVNVGGMHWTVAVAFMQEKRIQFFDSMCGSGIEYLEALFRYIKDEHKAKKGSPLPDEDEWELVECRPDTPQQENGFDCGVFTCMFCDFLSTDCPLNFSQEHITQCRERIALSVMKGVAIE